MGRTPEGRVVAVTGASSGIGAAIALACARRGMRLGLCARREDRLAEVAEDVRRAGGEAEAVPGDVREPESLVRLVTRTVRRWGRLDAIVANAGFGIHAPIAGTPPEEAREIFEVNVLGTVWAIRAAWPIFRRQGDGHFIVISSSAAFHGLPASALYSATKAAQMNLAEGLRVEAAEIGADVSVVYPVVTETEFLQARREHLGREGEAPHHRPRQAAGQVAEAVVAALERPRFAVYPYRRARLLPWLEALSPTWTERVRGYRRRYRTQLGDDARFAAQPHTPARRQGG